MPRSFLVLAVVYGTAACGDQPPPPELAQRMDSAGIEIVVSPDIPVVAFLIDSVPELSLGGVNAPPPEQFGSIQDIALGSDGSIWVSDRQSASIQVFERDGTHRTTVGRRGDGPGEYQVIRLVGGPAGDSMAVADSRNGRLDWYTLGGRPLGELRIGTPEARTPILYGVLPDGRPLGVLQEFVSPDQVEVGGTFGGEVPFSIWTDPTESPVEFTSAASIRFISQGISTTPLPFTTTGMLAVGDLPVVAGGPRFEVRTFAETGALSQVARIAREPIPVASAGIAEYTDFVEGTFPTPSRRENGLAALDHPDVPELSPAYADLIRSTDGWTWAMRWTPDPREPGDWDVFRPDGSYAGIVENPVGGWVFVVTSESVYGVWYDEFDVAYVRRHRLGRP